jgi:hypothetical protein
MYTREIQAPVDTPVKDGKPVAGSWVRPFAKIDLLEIEKPFPIPFPRWMCNFRIKEWQSFIIQNDEIYFDTLVVNFKFFRFIETTFYNKKTGGDAIHYFDYFPLAFWNLPSSLWDSAIICRAPGYFIAIHNWLDAAIIKLDVDIESAGGNPSINGLFEFYADSKINTPLAVNMLFSEERCVYTYKTFCPVRGNLKLGERQDFLFQRENTSGVFRDCKGIFPYITNNSWAAGFGFDKGRRHIGFSLGEGAARGANKDNENALWVDGVLTPLPPVRITQSGDIGDEWVIEDVEGMVDLTFTPLAQTAITGFNLIISKAEFINPIGVFTGFMMNKDGEKIVVDKISGCAERLYLRL